MDYEKRLVFPPPFSVFIYVYMMLKWLLRRLFTACLKCHICCRRFCRHSKKSCLKADHTTTENVISNDNGQSNLSTYNYWTIVAQRYSQQIEQTSTEKTRSKQIDTNLNRLREDLGTQKKSLQRLNDRVITMEKKVILNQSYLEQIKNMLSQKVGSKSGLSDRKKKNYIHILSRESPYVASSVFRFFVYEKLVPWEVPYDLYDVSRLSSLFIYH